MENTKMTRIEAITIAIAELEKIDFESKSDVLEKLSTLKETIKKKNSSKKSESAIKADKELTEIILATLTTDTPMRAIDIVYSSEELRNRQISSQKVTSILTGLKNDGLVIKDNKSKYVLA